MLSRTLAIGDIHGCSVALKTLIAAIAPQPDDTIVVLGDVVNYGPDSRGVIEGLMDLSRHCHLVLILGNHEQMLLNAVNGRDDLRFWIASGGQSTRNCYPGRDDHELIDPAHFRFLEEQCRDFYETEDFIFLHASYFPNRPMSEQSDTALRWEFIEPERMARHYSGKTVIAGHSAQTSGEILDLGYFVCLDTDCSRGGWLTALDVGRGEVIQANQQGEVRRSRRDQA